MASRILRVAGSETDNAQIRNNTGPRAEGSARAGAAGRYFMAKSNNRNMRFSDEVIEMIENQAGRNFTEKFENLVTRCVWELPNKETEIKKLDKLIEKRKKELGDLAARYNRLAALYNSSYETSLEIAKQLKVTCDNM